MSYQYPYNPGSSSMPATPQTAYRWDDGDPLRQHQQAEQQQDRQEQEQQHLEQQILQHPLQHQPEQQRQDVYVTPVPSTSGMQQLQGRVPIVPSQSSRRPGSGPAVEGDEPPQRLQHMSVPALLQPEHMRPPMIDTRFAYHAGASASPSSAPPSAGPSNAFSGVTGPVRTRISPVHPDPRAAVHPYRRPQSATGVPVIARSRRESEDFQSVRQSRSRHAPYSTSASTSIPLPAPPMSTPSTSTSMGPGALPANVKMTSAFKGLINPAYSASGVGSNFVIRTDLRFDSETSVLSALCELPGRSKSDVTIVLSTNPVNRVKQLVVTAKAPRGMEDGPYLLRERRSDSASRTFVVPSETTSDDVTVEMRDGLLSLKIQFPPPKEAEDAQDIVIC